MSNNSEEVLNLVRQGLVDSTGECFSAVFQTSLKNTDILEKNSKNNQIICSIGFAGGIEGNVSLVFSNQTACLLVSKMLSMDIPEVSSDVLDGVGELVNMIAGGLKNRLTTSAYNFEISIPTTIQGQELELTTLKDSLKVMQRFETNEYSFDTLVSFRFPVKKKEDRFSPAASTTPSSVDSNPFARLNALMNDSGGSAAA